MFARITFLSMAFILTSCATPKDTTDYSGYEYASDAVEFWMVNDLKRWKHLYRKYNSRLREDGGKNYRRFLALIVPSTRTHQLQHVAKSFCDGRKGKLVKKEHENTETYVCIVNNEIKHVITKLHEGHTGGDNLLAKMHFYTISAVDVKKGSNIGAAINEMRSKKNSYYYNPLDAIRSIEKALNM